MQVERHGYTGGRRLKVVDSRGRTDGKRPFSVAKTGSGAGLRHVGVKPGVRFDRRVSSGSPLKWLVLSRFKTFPVWGS
jgi:hypothetical protein